MCGGFDECGMSEMVSSLHSFPPVEIINKKTLRIAILKQVKYGDVLEERVATNLNRARRPSTGVICLDKTKSSGIQSVAMGALSIYMTPSQEN